MPSLATLDDAMLRAGRAVPAINRLGGGSVVMAGAERPWRIVGSDAVVYQLRQTSGQAVALRCPLPDTVPPSLAERYRALASQPVPASLRDASRGPLVGVTYLAEGLALPAPDLRSVPHPVIVMDWVAGSTLLAAVDRACRSADRSFLVTLAAAWLTVVRRLTEAEFAHGDLSGDNAMVRPDGSVALVDYDTCTWRGGPRPDASWGSPAYAHPAGTPAAPQERDAFAALVIYVSLAALAESPGLRAEYADQSTRQEAGLLFSPRDLADPTGSPLVRELRRSDRLQPLVEALRVACLGASEDVPRLLDIVRAPASPAASPQPPRPETARPTRTWPAARQGLSPDARERQRRLTRLNGLILAGDDEAARRFWRESGLANDPEAVREVGPRLAELERRAAQAESRPAPPREDRPARDVGRVEPAPRPAKPRVLVDRLRYALDAGDAPLVAMLWPEVRHDITAAPLAPRVFEMLSRLYLDGIAQALRRGDDEAIVRAVGDAEAGGIAVAVPARRAAREAAARLRTRREMAAALAAGDRLALAELAITGRLGDLGGLDPAAMRAVVRALAWPHLERALATDDDSVILAAYDPAIFSSDDALTPGQRARIALAERRTAWLADIRGALRRRDVRGLRSAMIEPPAGAVARLTARERARVERLTVREAAVEGLTKALRLGADADIVAALGGIETTGAILPADLDWSVVRGVVDRVTLVRAITRAAASDPPDYPRLARLLPVARAALEGGDYDLGPDLDLRQLEADVLRAAHARRLREALALDDDAAIAAAAFPDPHGVLPTLAAAERSRVERALASRSTPGSVAAVTLQASG